jgi:hypothetical protein
LNGLKGSAGGTGLGLAIRAAALYVTSGGAKFILSIDDVRLDRSENYEQGFSGCEVTAFISYRSDYNGNNEPNVSIDCEAQILATDSDGYGSRENESENIHFTGRRRSGQVEFDFDFYSGSPIIRAHVEYVDCNITSVDD